MSVSNINTTTTLPSAAVPGLPVRAASAFEGRKRTQRDGVDLPDAGVHDKTAQSSGVVADRFEPSSEALAGGVRGKASSQAAAQTSKEDKAKAMERELASIQQAATQTRYGVNAQPSLQRDFESLLMAVNSGNLTAAEQALTRLQGASTEMTDVIGTNDSADAAPLPGANLAATNVPVAK